jgi:uncharacterized protein YbgA (DUF1722 family)
VSKEIKNRIRQRADASDFSNRLLEIAGHIERDFDGREREQLLELVRETLNRHVEIRASTRRARAALDKLQSDQQTLLQLFDFITARPESEALH